MRRLVVTLVILAASGGFGYAQRNYADPIPNPFTFPDPCNNPTVRRWGPDDQKGNFNYITPEKILNALKAVEEGRLIRLDHIIEPARLRSADAKEWLTYGRDYAETHYSPLDSISPRDANMPM